MAKKLHSVFHRSKSEILWTIIPALLWLGSTYARPLLIQTPCPKNPKSCTKETLLPIDQLSIGMENGDADGYSYITQNFSGPWAFSLPLAWSAIRFFGGSLTPAATTAIIAKDVVTLFQVISWNGLFTELSHIVSQRPRPFVYMDPVSRGTDSAHYTSFYSGHTSFAASTTTSAFLILLNRKAPLVLLLISFASSQALILSTAYFRILAGRHFLTDVICGAIAGSLVAYFVVRGKKSNPGS